MKKEIGKKLGFTKALKAMYKIPKRIFNVIGNFPDSNNMPPGLRLECRYCKNSNELYEYTIWRFYNTATWPI